MAEVLDLLDHYGAKATFFVISSQFEGKDGMVQDVVKVTTPLVLAVSDSAGLHLVTLLPLSCRGDTSWPITASKTSSTTISPKQSLKKHFYRVRNALVSMSALRVGA